MSSNYSSEFNLGVTKLAVVFDLSAVKTARDFVVTPTHSSCVATTKSPT